MQNQPLNLYPIEVHRYEVNRSYTLLHTQLLLVPFFDHKQVSDCLPYVTNRIQWIETASRYWITACNLASAGMRE